MSRAPSIIALIIFLFTLPYVSIAQPIVPKFRINFNDAYSLMLIGNDNNNQRSAVRWLNNGLTMNMRGINLQTGQERFSINLSTNARQPIGLFYDWDGDQFDDFAVSVWNNNVSITEIYSGANGSFLTSFQQTTQGGGANLTVTEDLDGNGAPEVYSAIFNHFTGANGREFVDLQTGNRCLISNHTASISYPQLARDYTGDSIPDVIYVAFTSLFGTEIRILDFANCTTAGVLLSNNALANAGVTTTFAIRGLYYDAGNDQIIVTNLPGSPNSTGIHLFTGDFITNSYNPTAALPVHSDPMRISNRFDYDPATGLLVAGTLNPGVIASINGFMILPGQILPAFERDLIPTNMTLQPEFFIAVHIEGAAGTTQRYPWIAIAGNSNFEHAVYDISHTVSSPMGPNGGSNSTAVLLDVSVSQGMPGSVDYTINSGVPGASIVLVIGDCAPMPGTPLPGIFAHVDLTTATTEFLIADSSGTATLSLPVADTSQFSEYTFCAQAARLSGGTVVPTNARMITMP